MQHHLSLPGMLSPPQPLAASVAAGLCRRLFRDEHRAAHDARSLVVAHTATLIGSTIFGFVKAVGATAPITEWQATILISRRLDPQRTRARFTT
jgi:hypothetical protein